MAQLQPTLSQLLIRTRRYLNQEDASLSFWSDNFLKQLLNSEYRLMCAHLMMAFEGYFVDVSVRDITADQTRYSWPPNFQRLHKLELVRTDGKRVPIQRNERHERSVMTPQDGGDSYFPFYRPIGSGFELEPGPNETVTNGMRLEFYAIPNELEEDNDTLHADFPDLFGELIVLHTAIAAMNVEALMDNGEAQIRTLEYERARWEIEFQRFIDNRMASSKNMIEPFLTGYLDA